MRILALVAALLLGGLSLLPACDEPIPPVPASSDPEGKDIVKGAVVAAAESSGGIRLYKIVHVDDYPKPIGWELHMIAYDPKVSSFQDSAILWQKKTGLKVAMDYINVRLVDFLPRDHRVIKVEPVTDEELKPYRRALESRQRYNR
jgi:hypothetical protein